MLEVYQTYVPGATPCLFETRTLKEQLEDLKSPLAGLIDAFNFEKYRPQIIACIQRETTKQKIANQAPHEKQNPLFPNSALPKVSLRQAISRQRKDARGRRAFDPVLMFTIVMFGVRYRLSDEALAFKLRDSASFRLFLGLPANVNISRQTIWQYREYFTNDGLCESLARSHIYELTDAGLIGSTARILDGSFVEAPKQRNTREENLQIKIHGQLPVCKG